MSRKFYCGDRDEIPDKYDRRGSRLECLRKGIGTGMFIKEKELKEKYNLPSKVPIVFEGESEEERELRFSEEEKLDRENLNVDEYKKFMDDNFDKAKRTARNLEIGDVFKQLALLWKLEQQIKRKKEIEESKDEFGDVEEF